MTNLIARVGVMTLLMLAISGPANAYLGPGGVISGIGSLLALVAAVLVAIIGFLWFPIKRMIKRNRGMKNTADNTDKTG
ncbi:MAG: hypothetical protein GWP20_01070, partial [Thermotogales bacterium]|nr:hypothetical protein [Thermotogales bacterium]